MDNKQDLRAKFKAVRNTLNMKEKSLKLCEKLREQEFYKNSGKALIFYPLPSEVDLLSLLSDNNDFYLPRVCGNNMEICPFKPGDTLKKSDLKVCEPCSAPINPEVLDLIIVPALAVDNYNYRLGYGGGFYDRFIEKYPKIKTVVLIPEELCVEKLPVESFDKKVDFVIKG